MSGSRDASRYRVTPERYTDVQTAQSRRSGRINRPSCENRDNSLDIRETRSTSNLPRHGLLQGPSSPYLHRPPPLSFPDPGTFNGSPQVGEWSVVPHQGLPSPSHIPYVGYGNPTYPMPISSYREWEANRLRRLVEDQSSEITRLRTELDRAREQRDRLQEELEQQRIRASQAQSILGPMQMHPTNSESSGGSPLTRSSRQSSGTFSRQDNALVFRGRIQRQGYETPTASRRRQPHRQSSQLDELSESDRTILHSLNTADHQDVRRLITAFLRPIENWAARFPITPTQPFPRIEDPSLTELLAKVCPEGFFNDMLHSIPLRQHLLAAILNREVSMFLGDSFCGQIRAFRENQELQDLNIEIAGGLPKERCQEALEHRASVVRGIVERERNLKHEIYQRCVDLTENVMGALQMFVPPQDRQAAAQALQDIFQGAARLGRWMIVTPCEWKFTLGKRGDRWDTHSMDQVQEELSNDRRLTESNGFAFVVRLCVAPAITRKAFDGPGGVSVKEVNKMRVLLMANTHQRSAPGSGHRHRS